MIENENGTGAPDINDVLKALGNKLQNDLGEIMDLNHGIVAALREQAHNILKIRRAYLEEADRLYEVAITIADTIQVTGALAADMISVEFGTEFFGDEGLEEDEDDE